jgi:hypothetical protein
MVCAVGTPGIGKSTSTAILIRMLLKKGQTVVYLVRTVKKVGWYYEFIPTRGDNSTSINVNAYPETTRYKEIPSLNDPLNYYVVDPGQTKYTSTPDELFKAKFILVLLPDEVLWGESEFTKGRNDLCGTFKYYPDTNGCP